MGSNGNLNYGSYSGAGTPAVNGTFATGNLVAASAITGSTGAFTGQVTGPTPSTSTSFANKAYVDAHVSPAGTYLGTCWWYNEFWSNYWNDWIFNYRRWRK